MRYLGLVTISAAILSFGLALGAAPQPAAAQTAKKLKCKGCVKSKQLRNGGINSIDIGDGQVGNADLGFDAVTGDKVLDDSLTRDDLAPNSVGSSELRNNAVSSGNVVDDSLTASDLAPSSVGSSEVQNNSLTASDLGTNSVGTNELQPQSVVFGKIGGGAVGTIEVQDNSLTNVDLSNEAGVAYAVSNQTLALSAGVNTVVRSVALTAPSNGRVIVNASGSSDILDAGIDGVVCSITTGTATDTNETILGQDTGNSVRAMPFAGVRVFNVGPGSTTFNLVCIEFSGSVQIFDSRMAAIFVPTTY